MSFKKRHPWTKGKEGIAKAPAYCIPCHYLTNDEALPLCFPHMELGMKSDGELKATTSPQLPTRWSLSH
jgi:hypothetical protein